MPKIGTRPVEQKVANTKYVPQLESLRDLQTAILSESGFGMGVDVFHDEIANESMKNWFVNESADRDSFETIAEFEDHLDMMGEIYENNKVEYMNEATGIATINPTIGFNMLMHKNLMMNSVYAQGVGRTVAMTPKFVETFDREYLVTPKGERLDIALDQDKLTDAMVSTVPEVEVELKLPEYGATDIITKLQGTKIDRLAIDTYISAVKIEVSDEYKNAHPELQSPQMPTNPVIFEDGGQYYMWVNVKENFVPAAYIQDFDRHITFSVDLPDKAKKISLGSEQVTSDIVNANMKTTGNQRVMITSATGLVKAVKLNTKVDASLGTIETCSTDYVTEDRIFEIPAGVPINTTISPDTVKDINALYKLNHISKVMDSTMKILDNYKDDTIRKYLDNSFDRLADRYKVKGSFDFLPRTDYAHDVVEYRKKSFMDVFDSYGTKMLNALNDPDVSFQIFGRPDIIRKITPTEYMYQSPESVGTTPLDFVKTMVSSDRRRYSFLSSRKVKNDDLVVILKPNNGNSRKIYNLYEYSFYMGNEIRNNQNLALPSLHAYERFLMSDYQPVQGRITILNPTGYDKVEYKGL